MSAAPPSSQERFPYRIYLSERMYRMSESDADAWMDFRLVDRREQPEHYVKLAGDALETGDWEVAIGHLLKAIDLRERIRQEQPHDWQLGLTTTRDYLRMASIARSAEDPEYARNLYQTALDYTLQLQEQFPSLNVIREALADCQSGLAEMASESQDQEGVLRHLRNEVEIRRGLATLETPETLLKLAKGLLNLGSVERDNDDLNAALDAFNEGLQQVRIVLPVGGDDALAIERALVNNIEIVGEALDATWSGDGRRPRARILVLGTGSQKRFEVNEIMQEASRLVGRLLGQQGFALVTGGWEGVDRAVGEHFAKAFHGHQESLPSYQHIYAVPGVSLTADQRNNATVVRVENDASGWDALSNNCDACIMIHGMKGSLRGARLCIEKGKPVFPVVDSGGTSKSMYNDLRKRWQQSEIESIYGKAFDLSMLDADYEMAIASIMRYLEDRFPHRDPPQTTT